MKNKLFILLFIVTSTVFLQGMDNQNPEPCQGKSTANHSSSEDGDNNQDNIVYICNRCNFRTNDRIGLAFHTHINHSRAEIEEE